MVYKGKKDWKDLVEKPHHPTVTRRELLARGLATGALSLTLPRALGIDLINQAFAASPQSCPAPARMLGAIGQIFAEGGPTMGARFIGPAQANMMNAAIAKNYGISGQSNLVKIGSNVYVDQTSPFGFTLLQGPPGYPGGPAAWKTNVLNKVTGGGHLGPFNADDAIGVNSGLVAGTSAFKPSVTGKDLRLGLTVRSANWAEGLPSLAVPSVGAAPADLAKLLALSPAPDGLTTPAEMNNSANAANTIASALGKLFKNSNRNGSDEFLKSAGCSLYGNSILADSTYGAKLFDPTGISDLTGKLSVSSLTASEQAQLSAFYQSAAGVVGSVTMQFNGRDYHGASPQSVIAPEDIEEARAIVMFLAACDAKQAPGAMIYVANGQAIASGTQQVSATINGSAAQLNAPVAVGDAGGAYNAGLILFYSPSGSHPSTAKFTGKIAPESGNATIDANVGSSQQALAGLYLSALAFINSGSIPQSAIQRMQKAGISSDPSRIMVI